ncbi:hypothetical protein [Streptomyces avermitilis]|uniref:hypothetical protein n=1 Tax=Streptomyces avermitilis TaxID=33903 RepID=UPI0033A8502A
MPTLRFVFARGPLDGLSWERPTSTPIDRQLGIALDAPLGAVAIYRLQSLVLEPERRADFLFVQTVEVH